MAAPFIRRPGMSRRAQYGVFFGLVSLGLAVAAGIVLLIFSLLAPRTFDGLRGSALDSSKPAIEGFSAITNTINGLASGAGNYWDAAEKNAALRQQRDELRRELIAARSIERENIRLKAAIDLIEKSRDPIATSRIIGSSQDSPRRYAILSAGRSAGIENGMPVRSADGLIGRTLHVGRSASRILLITDSEALVPAQILRTGAIVVTKGRGDGTLDIRPIEVGNNPFEIGDIITTSGTGGLYPPGVPIARVVDREEDDAIGVPLANPSTAGFAMVEPIFEPAAMTDESDGLD